MSIRKSVIRQTKLKPSRSLAPFAKLGRRTCGVVKAKSFCINVHWFDVDSTKMLAF